MVQGPADPGDVHPNDSATAAVASPWRRAAGALVDGLVLGLMLLAFFDPDRPDALVFQLLTLGVTAAYEIGFHAVRGQTPGKMAASTRVVGNAEGDLPTWSQAGVRWAVQAAPAMVDVVVSSAVIDVVGLVYTFAVYVPILADPLRQGLHDRAAGTMVLEA